MRNKHFQMRKVKKCPKIRQHVNKFTCNGNLKKYAVLRTSKKIKESICFIKKEKSSCLF